MSELTGGREKGSKRMSWKYNKLKKLIHLKYVNMDFVVVAATVTETKGCVALREM